MRSIPFPRASRDHVVVIALALSACGCVETIELVASDGAPPDAETGGPPDSGAGSTIEWVEIGGDSFEMGSTASGAEQPIHTVVVPGFELSRSETTVAQYVDCVSAGACSSPATWSPDCYWTSDGFEDHPINCVSWDQAAAFCQWAGGRLPSEAEWEFAARSRGQDTTYPWGETAPSCDHAVMEACATGAPGAVCSIETGNTAQGVCDMAGNVWEWVQDGWHANYTGAPTNGSAWEGNLPVVRGGGYDSPANQVRAAYRGVYFGSEYNNLFLGFRCARSVR